MQYQEEGGREGREESGWAGQGLFCRGTPAEKQAGQGAGLIGSAQVGCEMCLWSCEAIAVQHNPQRPPPPVFHVRVLCAAFERLRPHKPRTAASRQRVCMCSGALAGAHMWVLEQTSGLCGGRCGLHARAPTSRARREGRKERATMGMENSAQRSTRERQTEGCTKRVLCPEVSSERQAVRAAAATDAGESGVRATGGSEDVVRTVRRPLRGRWAQARDEAAHAAAKLFLVGRALVGAQ